MIDLHCHILPSLDDGAQNLKESVEMAEEAVRQGITHILCTPHHNQHFQNPKAEVLAAVPKLQKVLDERKLPLTLFEGQEVRIHSRLIEEIEQENILFADVEDRYLLAELPSNEIPAFTESLFYELRKKGIIPIIVHPERNRGFQENPNQLLPYLNMGCLAQLTAPSLVGIYGKKIQKLSEELITHQLVQMVASDAHARKNRDFHMKEAYKIIRKKYGQEVVERMEKTCRNVINGDVCRAARYMAMP